MKTFATITLLLSAVFLSSCGGSSATDTTTSLGVPTSNVSVPSTIKN